MQFSWEAILAIQIVRVRTRNTGNSVIRGPGRPFFETKLNVEIFEKSEKKHGKLGKNECDKNEVEIAELWPWSGNPNDATVMQRFLLFRS